MLYIKINYFIHLLLNSKYRMLINLFIILMIYSLLYGNKFIYCMNENPDSVEVPPVAEAKESPRPSHQVLALKKEITDFAATQIPLLEQIAEQKKTIEALEDKLYGFIMKNLGGTNALRTENRISAIGNAIGVPLEEVTRFKKAYPPELKNTYERLVEEALKPVEVPQTKYYTYSPFEDYERKVRQQNEDYERRIRQQR